MYDWVMYDVGGSRGQRHAWVPFFEDGEFLSSFVSCVFCVVFVALRGVSG